MARAESTLGGAKAWLNWVLATFFVVMVFTLQTSYAITNVSITEDLGLSLAQVGLIGSIYTWAFALVQFASGSMMDSLGSRKTITFAAVLTTAGAFLFAGAGGPMQLVVGQVLMALGGAFAFVGAGFVGAQWFAPIKYGFMFALVQFVASLSAIGGQNAIGAFLSQGYNWSQIVYSMAFISLGLTVVMFLLLRDPVRSDLEQRRWPGTKAFIDELFKAIGKCMAIRHTWINALIGGATFGSTLSLGIVWGPRYLIAAGMDEGQAFSVSAIMWLGLAIGAPLFAKWSDLVMKRKLPMFAGCLMQLVAILVILMRPGMSPTEAYVWFFLWGLMAGGSILTFPIGADLVPTSLIGTSAAVCNAIQFLVGGLLMAAPGRVLDGTGLVARVYERRAAVSGPLEGTVPDMQWALAILPIALFLALMLFVPLKETYPKDEASS